MQVMQVPPKLPLIAAAMPLQCGTKMTVLEAIFGPTVLMVPAGVRLNCSRQIMQVMRIWLKLPLIAAAMPLQCGTKMTVLEKIFGPTVLMVPAGVRLNYSRQIMQVRHSCLELPLIAVAVLLQCGCKMTVLGSIFGPTVLTKWCAYYLLTWIKQPLYSYC